MRLAILLVCLLVPSLASAQEIGTRPGQIHPDFDLPRVDVDGDLRLSALRGRKLLVFHFASW